eukprot:TRINITY_DN879_c0_g1_i1.p1 TRINITY_DN879_c0_g1~~TRINITY_DN879_c0_g1_i1.p1  ORF type:complete len:328 (+),score=47.18 TRINITY_DN879_c0_g1_i1:1206-2189(+)
MLALGLKIPNLTHPSVRAEDQVLEVFGQKPEFGFTPRDHIDLGKTLDLIDFESASMASGEKFYYLKNEVALLELALVNWAMQKCVAKGFIPIITPDLVHNHIAKGCGYAPRGDSSQTYAVEDHDLVLVGTAEIALAGMHADSIIPVEKLPLKYVGFSHSYRVEAGQNRESKGLYRVHQFSKVEMFAYGTPTMSDHLQEEILDIQRQLYSDLGLHYRLLNMGFSDLAASASRKFDIEAWMPGRAIYGEISSCSNCLDYQARRLNMRYKVQEKENRFLHTVNGTACAVPRIIIAILENFQKADGTIAIPAVLQPFMGGMSTIPSRKASQ